MDFYAHLGSASVTANADGTWNSELRYREAPSKSTPYQETRYNSGLPPSDYHRIQAAGMEYARTRNSHRP